MTPRYEITAETLKSLLSYDEVTGHFYWLKKVRPQCKMGEPAGTTNSCGYRVISFQYNLYPAHRLAWFFVHGTWPTGDIDHMNGIRTDNRISNLRDCSHTVNSQNTRQARKHNKTGLLGAFKLKGRKNYRSCIVVNKKRVLLGTFETAEEAHAAYLKAKRALHTGCTI